MASKCCNKATLTLRQPYGTLVSIQGASGPEEVMRSSTASHTHTSLSLTCKHTKNEIKATECQQISEMWQGIKCVAESATQSIKSNSQLEGNA